LLVVKHHGLHVKARSLDEQTRNVSSIGRLGRDLTRVCEFGDLGVNGEFVEFVLVFLAVLLRECDHVGIRHLDTGQPGADRFAVLDPVVLLLHAHDQLVDPRGEFLVGEGRERLPALGDEAIVDVVLDDLELGGHGDEPCDHVRDVFQVRPDADYEFVDLLQFLFEHHVGEVYLGVLGVVAAVCVYFVECFVFFLRLL